jgi:hypothetical protein
MVCHLIDKESEISDDSIAVRFCSDATFFNSPVVLRKLLARGPNNMKPNVSEQLRESSEHT